jgi:hypothetical protein
LVLQVMETTDHTLPTNLIVVDEPCLTQA